MRIINYQHGGTETSPPAPPHKGGESAATERSSFSVASGQTLSLHREHGENVRMSKCGNEPAHWHIVSFSHFLRVLRVSVVIIYFLWSCTKPARTKYNHYLLSADSIVYRHDFTHGRIHFSLWNAVSSLCKKEKLHGVPQRRYGEPQRFTGIS
jgi:hypothetical protein